MCLMVIYGNATHFKKKKEKKQKMSTTKEIEEIKCLLIENNFALQAGSYFTHKFKYVKDNCTVEITPLGYIVERTDYIQFDKVDSLVDLLNLEQKVGCICDSCPGRKLKK